MLVGFGFGVSQKGDDPVLKGAEAAFDFAFGLGCGRDDVGHAKPAQGTLELAFGISVVSAGTGAEEAQAVRVDGFRQAMGFKSATEVLEVIPSGLGGNEGARDIATGVVIDGEQQILFVGSGPPLVDGAVVLIELADPRPAEPTVSPRLALRGRHQMRQVGFDVGLDAGSGALEAAEAFHFIRHELIVGRVLQGQKAFQEGFDHGGP